jgi:hypothetical protein
MLNTTFGYHAIEDRIWMGHDSPEDRIWITRRLGAYVVGPLARQVEDTVPGAQGGATQSMRVELEHRMALDEPADMHTPANEAPPPLRVGTESAAVPAPASGRLCHTMRTSMWPDGRCQIDFELLNGEVHTLNFSRPGLHRWLRAFTMILHNAQWALPVQPPSWLTASVLPQAVQAILDKPLPDTLDNEG